MATSWSEAIRYLVNGKELEKKLLELDNLPEELREEILEWCKTHSQTTYHKINEAVQDQIYHLYTEELDRRELGGLLKEIDLEISAMSAEDSPWQDLEILLKIVANQIESGLSPDIKRDLITSVLEELGMKAHSLTPASQRFINDLATGRR